MGQTREEMMAESRSYAKMLAATHLLAEAYSEALVRFEDAKNRYCASGGTLSGHFRRTKLWKQIAASYERAAHGAHHKLLDACRAQAEQRHIPHLPSGH